MTVSHARFLAAILAGRPIEARTAIDDLLTSGMTARSIDLDVLCPAMTEIGDLWQQGLATVAQEHLATAISSGQIARLAGLLDMEPATGLRAVIASTPGELHGLGSRMVADFLEAIGWEVLYLGPATPTDDLAVMVRDMRADLVGLSTALTGHLPDAREAIRRLHALPRPPVVIVGGAGWAGDPDLARRMGADLFGRDAAEAAALVRRQFAA